MKLFFEEPTKEFHLRQLARLLKRSPVTVQRYLDKYVTLGMLARRKERGLKLYSSNSENSYYKEYKRIYNRFKVLESGFLDFLKGEFSLPLIVLFGSYERGEDNRNSDIDVFVLTEIKRKVELEHWEKMLNRPVQLHVMSRKEFRIAKKSNSALINGITNGSVLHGFMEVL